MTFNYH